MSSAKRFLKKVHDQQLERTGDLQQACPCGDRHDGSGGTAGRKTWSYNEAVRLRVAGIEELGPETAAPLPGSFQWSLYEKKESQTCQRFQGSWQEYVGHLSYVGQQILPSGDKREAPFFSPPAYDNGRSKDENCEAVTVVWFDSDGAGTWETLKQALARSGVAAVFQESTSRKPDHWHVGIPLSQPLTFHRGEVSGRIEYKHAYRHLAAVFSALAGFAGVGGRCGLDLCTDRLIQPMFPAMRRNEHDAAARLEALEGQAVSWEALLRATGFDLAASQAAEDGPRKKGAARAARVRRYTGGTPSALGAFGELLHKAGWLGTVKDAESYRAYCPFNAEHSDGKGGGAWNAKYFPSNDTWWCPHSSCRGLHRKDDARAQLPTSVLHWEAGRLAKVETYAAVEKKGSVGEATAAMFLALVEEKFLGLARPLEALCGALLKQFLSLEFVIDVASRIDPEHGERRARLVRERIMKGKLAAGVTYLRRILSVEEVVALGMAVGEDSGNDPFDYAQRFAGRSRLDSMDKGWLSDVRSSLAITSKIAKQLYRPVWCSQLAERFRGDGEIQAERTHVCEGIGCPVCWSGRIQAEVNLLREGWTDDKNRKHRPWTETKTVYVHEVTGLKDYDEQDSLLERLKTATHSKLRIRTWKNGKPGLLLLTTDRLGRSDVRGQIKRWLHFNNQDDHATSTLRETDGERAIRAMGLARLSIHIYHRELVANRDREGLVELFRFMVKKRGRLFSRSRAALPWPNRKAVRAACRSEEAEAWPDKEDFLHSQLELYHKTSGILLSVHTYPMGYDAAAARAGANSMLRELTRPLSDADDEEERLIDAALGAELAAERRQVAIPIPA